MKRVELKTLCKQNGIKYSNLNKPEMIALLVDQGIILKEEEVKVEVKEPNPKYAHTKHSRTNPKRIQILDLNTGVTTIYPSLYKACRALGYRGNIENYNCKTWKNYKINLIENDEIN